MLVMPRKSDSPSSLSTFTQCPRRYQWDYLMGNPRNGFTSVEAAMGSVVHRVIEGFLQPAPLFGENQPRDLTPEFAQLMDDELLKGQVVHPKPERDRDWAVATGEDCLRNFTDYYERVMFGKEHSLRIEERVKYKTDIKGWNMAGFADLISETDDALIIRDWKTGAAPWPTFAGSSVARQLAFYAAACDNKRVNPKGKPIHVCGVFLAPKVYVKNPDGFLFLYTPEAGEELREWVAETAGALRVEEDWEPEPGVLCGWCRWSYTEPGEKFFCAEGANR